MGAPSINIAFIEQAKASIKRGERGIVAMLIRGETAGNYVISPGETIPTTINDEGREQIEMALKGYQTTPKKVIVYVETTDDYSDGLAFMAAQKFDWLVAPSAETDKQTTAIVTWIKNQRDTMHMTYKAVLPNTAADYEGIVDVANGYTAGGKTLTPEKVCSRVAGIICGTTTYRSCTYAPIDEASDCDRLTQQEMDDAVEAGKFIFFWDGEKVKVCRGVTSLTTTSTTKGDSFKKIRLVEFMDMIRDDIRITAQDDFIGKYPNSYDSKCILITAINNYFNELKEENVISSGTCDIDLEKVINYIKTKKDGVFYVDDEKITLDDATELQLKKADTGAGVYLLARIQLLDALEDITLDIYIV